MDELNPEPAQWVDPDKIVKSDDVRWGKILTQDVPTSSVDFIIRHTNRYPQPGNPDVLTDTNQPTE